MKKTWKDLFVTAASATLLWASMASWVRAEGGSRDGTGTRDGGVLVWRNQQLRLLDFVERSGCRRWETNGDQVIARSPQLQELLSGIRRMDWYFAHALEREIRAQQYCFGVNLNLLYPFDPSPVFRPEPRFAMAQGAERDVWANQVFVDEVRVNSLPALDQAGLWIHEAMHSFVPLMGSEAYDGRHYEHVRDLTREITRLALGHGTREELYLLLNVNRAQFPRSAGRLDRYRSVFEWLWLSPGQQREVVVDTLEPESLVIDDGIFVGVREFLVLEDQLRTPRLVLEATLMALFLDQSASELEMFLRTHRFRNLSVGDLLMSLDSQLSSEKRAVVLRMVYEGNLTTALTRSVETELDSWRAELDREGRICSNQAMVRAMGPRPVVCQSILSWTSATMGLQPGSALMGSAEIVKRWIQEGDWETVTALLSPGSRFRSAFELGALRQSIEAIAGHARVRVPREGRYSVEAVSEISTALWRLWIREVKSSLTEEELEYLNPILGQE